MRYDEFCVELEASRKSCEEVNGPSNPVVWIVGRKGKMHPVNAVAFNYDVADTGYKGIMVEMVQDPD